MKKIITSILAASLMLLGTSAFAQVSVGAGYSNSTYVGSSSVKNKPGNGFYAGLEYSVPIGQIFGISAGVNYEYVISKGIDFGSVLSVPADLKEQFINVPIRLNAGVNMGDSRIYVFGGPTMSYALSSKLDKEIAGFSIGGDLFQKGVLDNHFDVMVGGGIGLDLMERFRVTFGYDFGMFNKLDDDDNATLTRNRLHAGVAFLF